MFASFLYEQPYGFLRYTFSPIFSSRSGTDMLPSVEAMMIVLPEDEGPNSFVKSTLIVRMLPSILSSTFFILISFRLIVPKMAVAGNKSFLRVPEDFWINWSSFR